MSDRIEAIRARHATISASPAVADQQTADVAYLLDEVTRLKGERDYWKNGMDRHGPCVCDTNPETTSGPEEHCPHHGRRYAEWVERGDLAQERVDRVAALIEAADQRSPIGAARDRAHPDETASVLISTRDLRAALAPVAPDAEHAEAARVITLCGSTRFKAEFAEANQRLSMAGNVVISLGVFWVVDVPGDISDDSVRTLDRLHFQKIRMADEVYVIDVGGYVGESTRREIAYAESLGKPVRYLSAEPGGAS